MWPAVTKKNTRRKGRKGAVSGTVQAQATLDPNTVAVPDGMQPLPSAVATPAALQALQWVAQAVQKGVVLLISGAVCRGQ